MLHFTAVLALLICAVAATPMEERVPYENVDVQKHLMHGDMILTPGRAGHKNKKWTDGIVYYVYDPSIANEPQAVRVIKQVMAYYERITCLKFKKRTTERCYIKFTRNNDKHGCSSYVGKQCWGGGQPLNLAKGCWMKGVVIHELAHALGFLHEQDRPDRDQYVTIHKENIIDGWKNVLDKPSDTWNYDTSGTPYDYLSIMHYTENAFAKYANLITIELHDKKFLGKTGNKHDFSKWDVVEINRFYGCKGATKPPPTTNPPTTTKRPTTKPCTDNDGYCPHWQSYCSWHLYVIKNCKKTCNLC